MGIAAFRPTIDDVGSNCFSQAARIELAGLQPGGVDGDVVSIFFAGGLDGAGRFPAGNKGRCELAGLQPGGVDGDVVSIFFRRRPGWGWPASSRRLEAKFLAW